MFRYYKILLFLSLVLTSSCDSMKSISSKYNILYNGDLFLNEGLDQLRTSYKDNFWEIIPVIVDNNINKSLPDYPTKNFLKSEEKAIKVIQKMGNSRNSTSSYINEAYLLLGKSRFFDKRYISSLQAFNYILKQQEKSNIWHEAFYWRTLIYINLEQYELARSSLEKILSTDKITPKNLLRHYESISELYYKKRDFPSLIKSLKKTIMISDNKEQIRRSHYIIAQSYLLENKRDSASMYFKKAIDEKANNFKEIYLDAVLKLSLLKKSDFKDDSFIKILNQPRNLSSKAKINYYFALNYLNNGNLQDSKTKLSVALNLIENDELLKLKIYEQLFEINFKEKKYLNASNYLDTLIINLDKKTKKFFTLNKKREKLNSIADLKKQNNLIDSLLYFSTLDPIKLKDLLSQSQNSNETKKDEKLLPQNSLGLFYFNNRLAIENGKKQFNRLWGSRNRVDNWRLNSQNNLASKKSENNPKSLILNKPESIDYDLKKIPYQQYKKDSLNRIKNSNYFKEGIYLYEYFNDFINSEKSLLKVNSEIVSKNDFLQSRYYLYKIYSSSNSENLKKADSIKNLLIKNHPESIYSNILKNNSSNINRDFNVNDFLSNINQKTNKVLASIDSMLPTVNSRQDLFKLYLKKYEITAKVDGLEKYLKSLNELVELFPERAEELKLRISFLNKLLTKKSLKIDDDSFVLFFVVDKKEKITNILDIEYRIDNYNSETNLISIYGFSSRTEAQSRLQEIIMKSKMMSNNKYFVISASQYINMLVFKTLDKLKS